MIKVIPVAVAIFAAFIVTNVPSDASECTLSNIESLSQFIDERINAITTAIIAKLTATLEESIAASVNATLNALSITVDDKIATMNTTVNAVNTAVSVLNATVDERITTVSTTVGAHDASIAKLLSQPGKFVVASSPGPFPAIQYCMLKYIESLGMRLSIQCACMLHCKYHACIIINYHSCLYY